MKAARDQLSWQQKRAFVMSLLSCVISLLINVLLQKVYNQPRSITQSNSLRSLDYEWNSADYKLFAEENID